jgi:hypothetical protein
MFLNENPKRKIAIFFSSDIGKTFTFGTSKKKQKTLYNEHTR